MVDKNNRTRWQELLDIAEKIFNEHKKALPKDVFNELARAIGGVECMEHAMPGMIGNLVDSGSIRPMWRRPLTDKEKEAIVQATWEWYAAHIERALQIRDGEDGAGAFFGARLKFDGLMRLLDSLVDERIAGAWKDLLK